MDTSRRKFLVLASVLSGLYPTIGYCNIAILTNWQKQNLFSGILKNIISNQSSAASLGKIYLEQRPHEANLEDLIEILVNGIPQWNHWLTTTNQQQINETLLKNIQSDYTNFRIINLHGWLISETESRLCALIYQNQEQVLK